MKSITNLFLLFHCILAAAENIKKANKLHRAIKTKAIYVLAGAIASLFLVACTATSAAGGVTVVSSPSAAPAASSAPIASPSPTSPEETTSRISAISPVTIYSGLGTEHPSVGTLEAGASAQVIETGEGNWMKIACPDRTVNNCWVLWEPNSVYLYEGPALTLNIPAPASLKFETVTKETSPDGTWEALVTKSEPVSLVADNTDPWFFYVELKLTSQEDGRTWTPVSEWHAAGLGQEEPPKLFHWSKDGHFLYYTSLAYPDGACVYYDNIGDSLDRVDLTDGSVAALQPPYARGILAISPDETMVAYLHSETYSGDRLLIVRELATAYGDDPSSQNAVKWQIPLDVVWPTQVSQIAWSPESKKVVVNVTKFADYCQPPISIAEWELDVETGEWVKNSDTPFPTPTP